MSAAAEISWTPKDSEAGFFSLFDKAPLAVAQCQRQGIITAFNAGLEDLLGVDFSAQQSLRFPDLIHAQDRARAERLLLDLFEGKQYHVQIESRGNARDNPHLRWTIWKVSGIKDSPESAVIMAEEIPDSDASDEQVQHAARLESIGRLAGGVAHDFNNLLTGVLLYCDLLLASVDSGHRARKYAEEIRKAGLQASGLVRQLLAITRPVSLQLQPLSLNEIAEGMRNLLVRLIGENIDLQLRLDSSLGLIRMDSTQAQQILLNLVLNARDAMPCGGQITIETRNCKVRVLSEPEREEASLPCALFAVEDNGIGMEAFTRNHMFEPFFTTKAGKGTGLGLSTVHNIVITNGGLVHVGSEPGHGTRVSVFLPLLAQEIPPPSPNHFHPAESGKVLSCQKNEDDTL
jgi:two-component system cell cycle sensor histidine kinase/response regulator CckA